MFVPSLLGHCSGALAQALEDVLVPAHRPDRDRSVSDLAAGEEDALAQLHPVADARADASWPEQRRGNHRDTVAAAVCIAAGADHYRVEKIVAETIFQPA